MSCEYVSAIIGLTGVVLGAVITLLSDLVATLWIKKKKARYLAICVVCILDKFTEDCSDVAADDGEEIWSGDYNYPAELPELTKFPEDLDWKVIDQKLAYEILSLHNKVYEVKRYIEACSKSPGAFNDELGEERQYEFSILGIEVDGLANQLRKKFRLPSSEKYKRNREWNSVKFMKEKIQEIELRRKKDQEFGAEVLNNNS